MSSKEPIQKDDEDQSTPSKPKSSQRTIILRMVSMTITDIGLPLIIYFVVSKHLSTIISLIISGIPPTLSVIVNLIFRRQINVIGLLVITGFIAGIIVSVYQNDAKLFLLRESFVTGVIGLIFIITLIPIKIGSFKMRPLIFYNSKNLEMGSLEGLTEDEPIPDRWERYWRLYPSFRRTFYVLTAVWGFGLLIEVPARIAIIYNTTVDQAIYTGSIVFYTWLGCLVLFTVIYSRAMKKRGDELRKEQAEAEAASADTANNNYIID
ncbi:886_t:CDS:1 [Scutellospora calospora]|uniref:886_t:CDS:1 n=1 Tax=Scutellospora calospora TaxID=85575 RepID=A0ACA9L827_9GLOM|nr:886_t:CDS:1 [Scutellospora calospora]